MANKKHYGENAVGRDILDDICEKNREKNPEAYDSARSIPGYFGQVSIGTKLTKLNTISSKNKLNPTSFISDIIYAADNLKIDRGDAVIKLSGDAGDITVQTHESLIRFLKACIACSYNPNEHFSQTVAEFAKKVLSTANDLILPIEISTDGSKVSKIVLQELNEHIKEICDKNNIPYKSVVDAPKSKRSKVSKLLEQAAN